MNRTADAFWSQMRDYPSKFGQHFLTAWDNYRLYLLDGKCVRCRESVKRKQRYIILISGCRRWNTYFLSGGAEYEITMDASEKDVTERRGGSCFKMETPDRAKKRTGDRWKELLSPMMKIR